MRLANMLQSVAPRRYRLSSGSLGTQYEALQERKKYYQAERQRIEDIIEEITRQLPLSEGANES